MDAAIFVARDLVNVLSKGLAGTVGGRWARRRKAVVAKVVEIVEPDSWWDKRFRPLGPGAA